MGAGGGDSEDSQAGGEAVRGELGQDGFAVGLLGEEVEEASGGDADGGVDDEIGLVRGGQEGGVGGGVAMSMRMSSRMVRRWEASAVALVMPMWCSV